jgi:hypothetical protein
MHEYCDIEGHLSQGSALRVKMKDWSIDHPDATLYVNVRTAYG